MEEPSFRQPHFVGREKELEKLNQYSQEAMAGKGSTALISGEPGIGKSYLIEEFKKRTTELKVLDGSASADTIHPFLIFSRALEKEVERPLFEEQTYSTFTKLFAIDRSGLLVGQASPGEEDLDGDIFAGMLSAVQDFVRNSLETTTESAGIGRLEYGNMKILIEHGSRIFLTAVLRGQEHRDMTNMLKRTVLEIEEKYGSLLESWSGDTAELGNVQNMISNLARTKFLVRKNLEELNLENERFRIANLVLDATIELSKQKPLILFLEDLHWADDSSLFVLNYLARNIRDQKILVVSTLRRNENQNLENVIEGMRDEEIAEEIALDRLGTESVSDLVNKMFPEHDLPETFIDNLSSQCEGNPFFVTEFFLQMLEEGNIVSKNGTYVLASDDYSIPASVENVVEKRLQNLEPDSMALAEYASCIGKEFDRGVVSSLSSVEDADAAFGRLQNAGVVTLKNGTAEFAHAIFHEITYDNIGERWKLVYHKSLGEYYESEFDPEDVLYELARHYSRAGIPLKAYDYCIGAAEKAESVYAPVEAQEFYSTGLEFIPDLEKERRKEEEIKINLRIGENLKLQGRMDEAEIKYCQCIELAQETEYKLLLAEGYSHLAYILCHKPIYEDALRFSNQALEIYKELDNKNGLHKVWGSIGLVHYYQSQYPEALEYFRKQYDIAEEMGDALLMGRALSDMGGIYNDTGEFAKAMENHVRYLEIAEDAGDKFSLKDALAGVANVSYYQRNFQLALDCYQRLVELSEETGDLFMGGIGLIGLGATYEILGDYTKAIENLQLALAGARKMSYKQGLPYVLTYLGRLNFYLGNLEQAEEYLREAVEISESIDSKRSSNFALSNLGNLCTKLGKYELADDHISRAMEMAREMDHKHTLCNNIYQKANLYFRMGRLEESKILNDEALALAKEMDNQTVIFETRILGSKLTAGTDKSKAIKMLEELLAEREEDKEKAAVLYELNKLTGSDEQRAGAHNLYSQLYKNTPNIIYRERAEELKTQ